MRRTAPDDATSRRPLLEDPERYAREARDAGVSQAVIDAAVKRESAVLLQPSRTSSVDNALRGQSGTVVAGDYLGHEVLTAFKPLDLPGLNWVIVSKQDASEAFAPVRDFTRVLAISTAGIVLAVCVLGLLLAQLFARPIQRLTGGVRRIKQLGGTPATVSVPGPDGVGKFAQNVAGKVEQVKAAAQGPLHAVRGEGEQARMLHNARIELAEEAHEIATYTVIDALATAVGETAKLARDIKRDEEKMQAFLADLLPELSASVAHDEVPISEIDGPAGKVAAKA